MKHATTEFRDNLLKPNFQLVWPKWYYLFFFNNQQERTYRLQEPLQRSNKKQLQKHKSERRILHAHCNEPG